MNRKKGPLIISSAEIRKSAAALMDDYEVMGKVPPDVERLIELAWDYDTDLHTGLYEAIKISGYINCESKKLIVDRDFFVEEPIQFRFLLAQFAGQVWLFSHILIEIKPVYLGEWETYISSLSEQERELRKSEVDLFARLILVPTKTLHTVLASGKVKSDKPEEQLSSIFQVEKWVINERLKDENLDLKRTSTKRIQKKNE